MRKIKAHIKTSPDRNLTYKLYRDTLEANVPPSADLLTLLTPVATIKEADILKKAFLVSEEEAAVDITAIITSAFVPYTIKHNMLKSMLHALTVKIDYIDGSVKIFTVKFNNAEEIISIKDELDVDYNLTETFDLAYRNIIKIKDTYIASALKVRVSYYTEVIEIIDHSDPQVGVTYTGPVPLGKVSATLTRTKKDVINNAVVTPYYELMPTAISDAETYCYRLLAFDAANNISDPSDLMKISLQQPLAELKYKLQACLNTSAAEPVWNDTGYVVTSGQLIEFGKSDLPEFATLGSILTNAVVPSIVQASVQAVYSSAASSITMSFHNPWSYTQYTTRKTKALRLQAAFDADEKIKVYSSVLPQEDIEVEIDSVVIKRCEVTDPTQPFDNASAELIGRFCLDNGRLYNELKSSGTAPVLDVKLNSGSTTFNGEIAVPVVPMQSIASVDKLTVVDNQAVAGKQYKYAIVLEDAMKGVSTPTYKDVIATV